MFRHFQHFQSLGIPVPITKEHGTNEIDDTLGYVAGVYEQKDKKGNDALYAVLQFDEMPSKTIENAGASLESPAIYTVSTTGEVLNNPLVAVTITPTPAIPDMEPLTLALSLGGQGGHNPPPQHYQNAMNDQLAALCMDFLGLDATAYTDKEAELLEVVAKGFAELIKAKPEEVASAEAPPNAEGAPPNAEEVALSEESPAEAKPEKDEEADKDAQIAELQLSLAQMHQEQRMTKLNALAQAGKLSKGAFDQAKATYGGNLALSRQKEFNDFVKIIEANHPVVQTQSATDVQVLPHGTKAKDPFEKHQEAKYSK